MVDLAMKEKVKRLSQQIVEIQRPIRILDAIKWDPRIELELKKSRFKEMPQLGSEDYQKIELGFHPGKKMEELKEVLDSIEPILGSDPLGGLLREIVEQYMDVVRLLLARGTQQFSEYSKKLYGSPKDRFFGDGSTIFEMSQILYSTLSGIDDKVLGPSYPENCDAQTVVSILYERLRVYFSGNLVHVKLSDGILADAAAGGDTLKIKGGSFFSKRDIDILEVHEGWVHLGTTQNGLQQTVAKWLSKGPPRCSATQEGLAVLMEIFTFRTYPRRARHINDRILGIMRVEEGANLLELIEFYRTEGYSEEECIANAQRIFRGGLLEGGAPFTKDISYCRGFIENYNFIRAAIRAGSPQLIPFLFVGKAKVDDIPLLYRKYLDGWIDFPLFLPPQFQDLNGITVWMTFLNFVNTLNLQKTQEYYNRLFQTYL